MPGFLMVYPWPLLVCFVLVKQKFNKKTVDLSEIQTCIVGVECKYAYHLNTTTVKLLRPRSIYQQHILSWVITYKI